MSRILNFGSINIDHVYEVDRLVKEGETKSASQYNVYAGGKGANQSVALAKAGASCFHAGKIGQDGVWIRELMEKAGVDCRLVVVDPKESTGTAIIQVCESSKQNAILIWAGGNATLTSKEVETVIHKPLGNSSWGHCDWLVVQNELVLTPLIISCSFEQGMWIAYNPAPLSKKLVTDIPWEKIDILVLNESETLELMDALDINACKSHLDGITIETWKKITTQLFTNNLIRKQIQWIVVTLGKDGALAISSKDLSNPIYLAAFTPVNPILDTTGAGDTFFGFLISYLASLEMKKGIYIESSNMINAMKFASAAASIAITSPGAIPSIPSKDVVLTCFPELH